MVYVTFAKAGVPGANAANSPLWPNPICWSILAPHLGDFMADQFGIAAEVLWIDRCLHRLGDRPAALATE